MITISLMRTGISVATTQGIVVENIKTWVILMTLMIKRVSSGAYDDQGRKVHFRQVRRPL